MFEWVWSLAIFSMPIFLLLYIFWDDFRYRIRSEHYITVFIAGIVGIYFSQNIVTFLNGDFRNMTNQMLKNPEQNITLPSPTPREAPNKYMNGTIETPKNQTQPWDNDWLKK